MKIIVLGAGMMGRVIAFDLCKYSNFENITITDKDRKTLDTTEKFLEFPDINFDILNIEKINDVRKYFEKNDIVISAVPYIFNHSLTKIAIETQTHLLDLGGNNDIVGKQRNLFLDAKQNNVTIIPDCGLAPGMTSVITRDLVETMDTVNNVKIRVGGLPINPQPPLNYQIVFSPNGLINEYVEDAIVLENGKIMQKKSMTELEEIIFPNPFGKMEAFLTSGGCSTLPYTYKDKIKNLDYKTIRYLGHCEKFKPLLDIKPREKLIAYLLGNLPSNEKDVVLLRVSSQGIKDGKDIDIQYTIIDYYDNIYKITSMMRTTAYPTSIIAQMIEREEIMEKGVFCGEEIVPCSSFFKGLKKRNIKIHKEIKKVKHE
jgi:lysine 6-dehydrogenase